MKGDHQSIAGVKSCNDAVVNRLSIGDTTLSDHQHFSSILFTPLSHLLPRNATRIPCTYFLVYPHHQSTRETRWGAYLEEERSSSSYRGTSDLNAIWFHDVRNYIRHLYDSPICLERK